MPKVREVCRLLTRSAHLPSALFFGLTLLSSCLASSAIGQMLVGSIQGVVTDEAGGYVKNAKVTITGKATGKSLSVVSDASGAFALNDLMPGDYSVAVEAPGFRIVVLAVAVVIGKITPANAILETGSGNASARTMDLGYTIVHRYPLPDGGPNNSASFDSLSQRLYVSRSTQIQVLNVLTEAFVGTIPDIKGDVGMALASQLNRGFVVDSSGGQVSMFELSTLKFIKTIGVGKPPDLLYFDPASSRLFSINRRSGDITAIDPNTGESLGTFKAYCDGVQALTAADGLVYVSSERSGDVVVFDPNALKVKKRFPITTAKRPAALAYIGTTNWLFVNCLDPGKVVVLDAASGKEITTYWSGRNAGDIYFDAKTARGFIANSDG
ncbi:MAG: carboxypeptidase regulatory-like domain-containing protein, partial [Blastocatellia bacterium]